jgi:hypothetical protein
MSETTGYAQVVAEIPVWTKARFDAMCDRLAARLTALRAPETATEQQLCDALRVLERVDGVIDSAILAGRRKDE